MIKPDLLRLLLIGSLLACGGSGCAEQQKSAVAGEVLRIGVGLSGTARTSGISALTELLYAEPLLAREWDGRIGSRIAESWEWENDGAGLRIRLRPSVRFHDGSPLSAAIVADLLRPRVGGDGRAAAPGFQHVTGISVLDANTLVFHLTQPDLLLAAVLSDIKITKPGSPEVSTGPFRLMRTIPSPMVERFEDYHRGRAGVARVEIVPYETQRAAWAALLRQQVDAVQEIDREAVEFLLGNKNVNVYSSLQPFYIPLVFNVRHPVLSNVSVRRALAEAVDSREIIARILRGKGSPAIAPVWPFHWAAGQQLDPAAGSPPRARAMLDSAGYPERRSPGGPPTRFTIKCLVWGESALYEQLALLVQRQLFAVGVNLDIELGSLEDVGRRVKAGEFEAFILPTNSTRTLERTYWLWRSRGPENPDPAQDSGYTGADLWLDRLRRSSSEAETREALTGVIHAFQRDVPAIFIAWLDLTRAVDARFSVGESKIPDPFQALWLWRPVSTQ